MFVSMCFFIEKQVSLPGLGLATQQPGTTCPGTTAEGGGVEDALSTHRPGKCDCGPG